VATISVANCDMVLRWAPRSDTASADMGATRKKRIRVTLAGLLALALLVGVCALFAPFVSHRYQYSDNRTIAHIASWTWERSWRPDEVRRFREFCTSESNYPESTPYGYEIRDRYHELPVGTLGAIVYRQSPYLQDGKYAQVSLYWHCPCRTEYAIAGTNKIGKAIYFYMTDDEAEGMYAATPGAGAYLQRLAELKVAQWYEENPPVPITNWNSAQDALWLSDVADVVHRATNDCEVSLEHDGITYTWQILIRGSTTFVQRVSAVPQ
jgi:hypothetical protein